MCCVFTTLLLAGPRLGILVWWLLNPVYIGKAFDTWFWPFLGWLFLPWTTLMYIAIYPGGIVGFDWLWMGLAVFADMASYFGGYRERARVPYGEQIPQGEEKAWRASRRFPPAAIAAHLAAFRDAADTGPRSPSLQPGQFGASPQTGQGRGQVREEQGATGIPGRHLQQALANLGAAVTLGLRERDEVGSTFIRIIQQPRDDPDVLVMVMLIGILGLILLMVVSGEIGQSVHT